MVAPSEGPRPNFDEAFTQLHLGQFLALVKCFIGDRRDGGIDPNMDYILWNIISARPRVDETSALLSSADISKDDKNDKNPPYLANNNPHVILFM